MTADSATGAEAPRGPSLYSRKIEQVVHDPGKACCLGTDPRSQASHDIGVFFAVECLCEKAQRPERGFQLMAQVGDEVPAHCFQPAQLGHVVYQGDRASREGSTRRAGTP